MTCGFGASFFNRTKIGNRPDWLEPLPKFTGDRLDNTWGERDIVLQICGDDRTTVSHAVRVLVRGGADYARPSWSQEGVLDIPLDTDGQQGTPRNLFGFKDGTVNPTPRTSRTSMSGSAKDHSPADMHGHPAHAFDMPEWEP